MTGKTLITLIAVAAGAAGAAYVVSSRSSTSAPSTSDAAIGSAFIPGLADHINDVAEIHVKHGSKPSDEFTVRRAAGEGGGWVIAERADYPAKFERVKDAIVGLSELKRAEALTSKPEKYPQLGVQDPATYVDPKEGEAAFAYVPTLLTLHDAKGTELASLIVGGTKDSQPPATFVRRPSEAKAWLCTNRAYIPGQVAGWVEQEFLRISGGRIKSAKITPTGGDDLLVVKDAPADTAWAVQNVPEGKHLRGPNIGDQIALALSSMSLDDVTSVEAVDFDGNSGGKPTCTFDFRTFDGLVLTGAVVEKDSKSWFRVAASVDETAKAPEGAPEAKSLDDVKKEVAELNARLARYAFQLPDWKVPTFKSTLASMFDDTPVIPPPTLNDPNIKSLPIGPQGEPKPMVISVPGAAEPPHQAPKPDAPKPDAPKPEEPKSDAPKPEAAPNGD